jgi:integrase
MRSEWQTARLAIILALNTTCRACELKGLQWHHVDFMARTITIHRSKTEAGLRTVPLNPNAWQAILGLRDRIRTFYGTEPEPDWYLFPSGEGHGPTSTLNGATVKPDPTKPMTSWRTAWRRLTRAIECPSCGELQDPADVCRNQACGTDIRGVKSPLARLRFHDLRHHAITRLAEAQNSDQTIMAIAGHVSEKMLRHYSHVRLDVMRKALDGLAGGTFGGSPVTNAVTKSPAEAHLTPQVLENLGGRQGIRTPDPRVANAMLSQLS